MSAIAPDGWEPSPPIPALEAGIAHVWRCRVPTEAPSGGHAIHNEFHGPTEQLSRHLTADERARMLRFRRFADRARFATGRGLLRGLLGHYLAQPPTSVRLCLTPAGKPALDGMPFNVSHSGEWVLVAIACAGEVGVDVEAARPLPDLEALTARFFAPAEAAALAVLPPEARADAFFRIWTRKEAFVKATGEGIGGGLDGFTVSHDDRAEVTLAIAGDAAQGGEWTLRAPPMPPGYAAAIAVRSPTCTIRTWEWQT